LRLHLLTPTAEIIKNVNELKVIINRINNVLLRIIRGSLPTFIMAKAIKVRISPSAQILRAPKSAAIVIKMQSSRIILGRQ